MQQYDYFKYEIIRKEKNKEAVALLQKNQVFNVVKKEVTHAVVKKEVTHAYVDASVRFKKKEAYIAGVLKNKQGISTMSFSKPCAYSQNITRIELEATIEMMKQATEAGCTPVIIHTDSQAVYDFFQGAVKKVRKRNEKIHTLVKQAKKQYPQCTVAKIPRTHNKEAHNLAISAKGTVKVHIN